MQVDARAIPIERRAYRSAGPHSIWNDRKDLYRDPRATRVGDLLTVNILMNDKAILDNKTDRSRDSQIKVESDYSANIAKWLSAGNFDTNVKIPIIEQGRWQDRPQRRSAFLGGRRRCRCVAERQSPG